MGRVLLPVSVVLCLLRLSFGQDSSKTFGEIRRGDVIFQEKYIKGDFQMRRAVTRTVTIRQDHLITAVEFKDLWRTGAIIDMKNEPPFKSFRAIITSQEGSGFNFKINLYKRGKQDDMTQIFGRRIPGAVMIHRKNIQKDWQFYQFVTFTDTVKYTACLVTAVKFTDLWKTGASIALDSYPPFRSFKYSIVSQRSQGFRFMMELFC